MGVIHGGALAEWVDLITGMAISTFSNRYKVASVDLNVDYIGIGKIG